MLCKPCDSPQRSTTSAAQSQCIIDVLSNELNAVRSQVAATELENQKYSMGYFLRAVELLRLEA